MTDYRIVCVETEHPHRHILAVGTGTDPGQATDRWTTEEVRAAIFSGDRFYTVSPSSGAVALVEPYTCPEPRCNVQTLRSTADVVTDNNLDNLRACSWR